MDGVGAPTASTISSVDSPPESPPHDPDNSPYGSPERDVPDILALPSDDDHDHDHGEYQDKPQEDSPSVAVLSDDLKLKIVKQVEYYFSDENLPTDKYMMNLIKKNKEGFVPISMIAPFRKMKKLTRDHAFIGDALKESSFLAVSSNGKKVKRRDPLPEFRDSKLFTVLIENLPEDHSVENIRRIFGEAGNIRNVSIRDPHAVEESKKGNKAEILLSSKLHALVEYETIEAADKAVATLNDEQDWRNGMRVKALKRMGNYGQRRQAWRGSDSEKNVIGRAPDHVGDAENNHSSEHHDDVYEEEGDHLSKDKNGQKGRNRGRSRRQQKYRGTNGHGHGTTSSSHVLEASKPPPGPKMPDGTRGFAMGRGRPPVSI